MASPLLHKANRSKPACAYNVKSIIVHRRGIMKKYISAILLSSLFIAPVMAEKPEWAGKGKPTEEQKAEHRAEMEAKDDVESERRVKELKEKKEKKEKKVKKKEIDASVDKEGLEKQKSKKLDQEQKELDKGSAKGKEAREENSKKWWNFWGE